MDGTVLLLLHSNCDLDLPLVSIIYLTYNNKTRREKIITMLCILVMHWIHNQVVTFQNALDNIYLNKGLYDDCANIESLGTLGDM